MSGNEKVQLVRYQKGDRQAVFSFLREVHPPPIAERLIQQWRWKYDFNPFNQGGEPLVFVLRAGSRIVGLQGVNFLRVCIAGSEHWATQGCDLVVHPEYRKRALSRMLIKAYLSCNPIGFSWTNAISRRSVAPLSSASTGRLRFAVKPLDAKQILRSSAGGRMKIRLAVLLAFWVDFLVRMPGRPGRGEGVSVMEIREFDSRADDLWRRARRNHPVMVVRNQRYLNWRFVLRPDVHYTLLEASKGGKLLGYAVLRLAEKDGMRWGYIVDSLAEENSRLSLSLLMEEGIRRLQLEGAALIVTTSASPCLRRVLYRLGFGPWRIVSQGYFQARVDVAEPEVQAFKHINHWYLTMGDGDLEMAF